MRYRNFGGLDWKVSALGFGCMRLPTTDSAPASPNVAEEEAIRMIRHALDNGVNYVDSAYVYHSGRSEVVLGKALRDGYRDKAKIATKAPVILIKTEEDYDRFLDEQLKRLGVDRIDFYLFHGLAKNSWDMVKSKNLLRRAESALKAGKIGHIGFSFHDRYEVFAEIVNGYDGWSMCQIQYNFMDSENQAGTKGLKLAASRGLGVVIMEPLLGGKLADPPEEIRKQLNDSGYAGSTVDLAFKWLWDQPEVSVVLSGMSAMDHVIRNVRLADQSAIGSLSGMEAGLIGKIRHFYEERTAIPCTNCGYCLPCPNSVNIPMNFKLYNDGAMYGSFNESKRIYRLFLRPEQRAESCIQCRTCEGKCPQKILISEWMLKIKGKFL
jgi:predicted aldo/keto reductase-like oxidoreductase